MSELMNPRNAGKKLRRHLLTTVSAIALIGLISARNAEASDNDADHSIIWIELGGQLEHITGDGEAFAPPFLAANAAAPVFKPISPSRAQKAPFFFGFGEEGKLALEPEGTDWVFTVAARYGRSNRDEHVHQQSAAAPYESNYVDTVAKQQGSHAILDFEAGKDIGVGAFGVHGTSTLSAGVRAVQFSSNTTTNIMARPNVHGDPNQAKYTLRTAYAFNGSAARSFRGVGPSLSWNASTVLLGNQEAAEVALEFGANGAVLFGRQKVKISQHTAAKYIHNATSPPTYSKNGHRTNARSVVVPNAGGFAAISVRRADVSVSLGYRADFFFGAVDRGIDTRESGTLGFCGPFATIDIAIGG